MMNSNGLILFFCPIEMAEKIAATDTMFRDMLQGPPGSIREYWDGVSDTDLHQPIAAYVDKDNTIPLGFHGDKAPTSKNDGLFTISWSSQTVIGETRATKLIFTVVKGTDLKDGTLARLFDYFAWAMNALMVGKIPEKDHRGRKLKNAGMPIKTKSINFACNQLRGDWEFYTSVLNFPRWDSEPGMCWICNASNSIEHLLWTNGRPDAGWRPGIRTHDEYITECLACGGIISEVFKILALRSEGVMIDVLHALDQGVTCHVVANVFLEVVTYI